MTEFLFLGTLFSLEKNMYDSHNCCPLFLSFLSVFHKYYHGPTLVNGSTEELHGLGVILHQAVNGSEIEGVSLPAAMVLCTRERPILCLLLMLGTLWLGYALFLIKRRSL